MKDRISKAIIMAAGKGTRMGDLSLTTPKPLTQVHGRTLLDRIIDRLEEADIGKIIINIHHLGEKIEKHIHQKTYGPEISISDETNELLGQGGGIKKALPFLGHQPFLVINGDALWVDDDCEQIIQKLMQSFDSTNMNILMALVPVENALGYDGNGDFFLDKDNLLSFKGEKQSAPFVFSGIQIMKPEIFSNAPEGFLTLKPIFDTAEKSGRLYGCQFEGHWMHVGTKAAITEAENKLHTLGKI